MICNIVRGVLIYSGVAPILPTPTPTPTYTPTPTITISPTPTPTITITPSFTPTFTPSVSAVSVSAFDYSAMQNQLWGVDLAAANKSDTVVGKVVLDSIDYQSAPKDDTAKTTIGMSGVGIEATTRDSISTNENLVNIEHESSSRDTIQSTQTLDSIVDEVQPTESAKASQVLSGVDYHAIDVQQSTHNVDFDGISHLHSRDSADQDVTLTLSHDQNSESKKLKVTEALTGTSHQDSTQSVGTSNNLEGINDQEGEINAANTSNSLNGVGYIDATESSGESVNFTGVEQVKGLREDTKTKISLQQIKDTDVTIDRRSKVTTALSSIGLEFDRVEYISHNIGVTGIQHTDDTSQFRISEKVNATGSLSSLNHEISDDENSIGVTNNLDGVDHEQNDQYYANIQHSLDSIDHQKDTEKSFTQNSLDGVSHSFATNQKQAKVTQALTGTNYTDAAQSSQQNSALTGVNLTEAEQKVRQTSSLSGVVMTPATNLIDIFGKLDALDHVVGPIDTSIIGVNLDNTNLTFQEGRTTKIDLTADNLTHIFGDTHSIGVVMGIGDGGSIVYAAQPTLFDMSMIGLADSIGDSSNFTKALQQMSGVEHTETTFKTKQSSQLTGTSHVEQFDKIGANMVLDNLIHSLNTDGILNTTIGIQQVSHSKGRSVNTANMSVGLFYLSHVRDLFYFDNTDTVEWSNDIVRWDYDPNPPS